MVKKTKTGKTLPANMAKNIILKPVEELQNYERNSRTHSKTQIAQIAASMGEFGFTMPILAKADGTIIAGHGRFAAALLLEYSEVPVIVADYLTDDQARAYCIADNKLSDESGWNNEILINEMIALENKGYDLNLLGYDGLEIDQLLEEYRIDDAPIDHDEEPPVPNIEGPPITAIGDLWVLGEHRLLCATPTRPEAIKTLIQGDAPDVIIVSTDPAEVKNIELTELKKIATGAKIFIFLANLFKGLPAGNEFIIWDKTRKGRDFSDSQIAWSSIPGGIVSKYIGPLENADDFPDLPDQKPPEFYEKLLRRFPTKAPALELFSGIGNGLIAAQRNKKSYRALEIDARAVDNAIIAWQNETGEKAILEETGETFGSIYGKRRNG